VFTGVHSAAVHPAGPFRRQDRLENKRLASTKPFNFAASLEYQLLTGLLSCSRDLHAFGSWPQPHPKLAGTSLCCPGRELGTQHGVRGGRAVCDTTLMIGEWPSRRFCFSLHYLMCCPMASGRRTETPDPPPQSTCSTPGPADPLAVPSTTSLSRSTRYQRPAAGGIVLTCCLAHLPGDGS
jgi:hypothetical protein